MNDIRSVRQRAREPATATASRDRSRHLLPLSRRKLLTGAAAGGGLLVAWLVWPRSYPSTLSPGRSDHAYGAWLTIANDGVVTVAVPQLEMGQGVTTVLPQIVAVELGADWRQIAVQPVPPSGAYPNLPLAAHWAPLWMPAVSRWADWPDDWLAGRFARSEAFTATASGTTLAAYEMACREAGASARGMLVEAAAARWNVAPEACEVENGLIISGANKARFGELAQEASELVAPDPPPLYSAAPRDSAGFVPGAESIAFPRLDLPAKVDGSLQFAGDVRLPEMVYASIRHGPVGQAELAAFDAAGARGLPGLVGIVNGQSWLAAIASDWWTAERALTRMRPQFRANDQFDTDAMLLLLERELAAGEATLVAGNPDGPPAPDAYSATYRIYPAVHATIEQASATAHYTGDRLELWAAAQAPEQARLAAAKAVGLDAADVVLYPVAAGGSFDARLDHTHAIEVAHIAKAVGRPVQLTWPRRQEFLRVPPRTPAVARLTAQTNLAGTRIDTLWSRIAMPPTSREFGHRLFDNYTAASAIDAARGKADPLALEGFAPPYAMSRFGVEHVPVSIPLPTGPMRGNAAALGAFCLECFVDELAEHAGVEPLSYRIAMLGDDPRMVACLQRVGALSGWDGAQRSSGQGLACVRMQLRTDDGIAEGRIACVTRASAGEGGVRVSRIDAAVDIGRIVNLDIARQQIEGALIFGMSLAVGSSVRYRDGVPVSDRLATLNLPTLATSPEVEVVFLPSDELPFDPGELGTAVAPPAIANAMFAVRRASVCARCR